MHKGKEYVDVRSYEVEISRKKKIPLMVIHSGQAMEIKDFRKRKVIDPQTHQMQYPPFQTYKLYSYEWLPTQKVPNYKVT